MIAKFNVSDLKPVLSKTERIAVSTNSMPILQCVKISVSENTAILMANDAEIGIRVDCPCVADEDGVVLVNARRLASLVRQLPDGDVVFRTTANDRVVVEAGTSKFRFALSDVEQYPDMPVYEADDMVLSGADLHRILGGTVWGVAAENTRPYIGGVFWNLGTVRAVGTDRKVFASHWSDTEGVEGKAILDRSLVTAALGTFDASGEVAIGLRDNQIVFTSDGVSLIGRLVESEFPDFDIVFQKVADNAITVRVDRMVLISALRRALLFASQGDAIPKAILTIGGDLTLQLSGLIGASEEHLDAEISGELELACNGQYLLNALNVLHGQEVLFKFDQAETPFSIEDDSLGIHVIMPLRA